jgi:hypothetical protein
MAATQSFFATHIYNAPLGGKGVARLNQDLERACLSIARDDKAGQAWSRAHAYRGFTSYASLNDLTIRAPEFADLERRLRPHIARFAKTLHFDLGAEKLRLDSIWINVTVPKGASALKFEDPRLGLMMAAPRKKETAPREAQPFVYITPSAGSLVLFESWLRHEVPPNTARQNRISVSFNYA